MNSRLRGWHSKLIPQEGRTTQLNSVLSTMDMYQMQVFKLPDTTIAHMNKIQRQYWWHNFTNHKSPRVISWDNVNLPKKLGGLGLKNLKNYNSIVLKHAKLKIGNGTTINIWTHNWIPDLNAHLQDWYDFHLSNYQWVSQLIDTSSSQWNVPLLRQLFTSSQVDSILTIPIQLDQQDSLKWPLTAAGIFTTKSTYHHLCESQHSVAVATTLSTKFWLKFRKLQIPYKFQPFLWKIFQNYLPVKTKLFHQNIITSSDCVLCNNNQLESVDHLMYYCPFTAAIWRHFIPQMYQDLSQHQHFIDWIRNWQSPDSEISIYHSSKIIHIIACMLHTIWKHRCQVIFNNATPNITVVIRSITNYLHFHHLTLSDNTVIPVRNNLRLDFPWQPPPPGFLKINIDASFHPNFNLAGIGILIRDHAGRFVASKGVWKRTHSAFQAEAWALVEGMNLALSHGWHQVIFESDNLIMCRFVQQQHPPPPWRSLPLLKSCINMCNNSSLAWSCNHVYRCCNKAADALAKAVRRLYLNEEWWYHPRDMLIPHLNSDNHHIHQYKPMVYTAVIVVLVFITILGVLSVIVGRLCSGKRVIGIGEYDFESWVERKCSTCIDGRIDVAPNHNQQQQPSSSDHHHIAIPAETPPEESKPSSSTTTEQNPNQNQHASTSTDS
ncbi:uncharacterized protein LOC113347313 [Papaver somniferum]|uniref:uncharacterized protein LOC113347313 n=1 Tax=Papaver somniferum TaxID=3469 RepID=UPI000E70425E|nr:uncharacterized protein LOC113347313 [Papaver somniferum]